jgi:hypothetical protein
MKAPIFALLTLAFAPVASQAAQSVIWQQSTHNVVELSVRDKYGTLGAYDAIFNVTMPDGHVYSRTVHVNADDEGTVNFPEDEFLDAQGKPLYYAPEGKLYRWEARVNGQKVIGGSFLLGQDKSFQ